jgi:hypothetical protein
LILRMTVMSSKCVSRKLCSPSSRSMVLIGFLSVVV